MVVRQPSVAAIISHKWLGRAVKNNQDASLWFQRVLQTPTSLGGLRTAISLLTEGLGFRFFIFQARNPLRTRILNSSGDLFLSNTPLTAIDFRREHRITARTTDIVRRALAGTTPVRWRDVRESDPALASRARAYGLLTGSSHVVHGREGDWSILSFIRDIEGSKVEREIDAALPLCQLLSCHVHDAAARIAMPGLSATPHDQPVRQSVGVTAGDSAQLSSRERECLGLAGAGLTAAEIARHLNISERTAIYHLMVARRKLGSTKTRQAFTKAIALGLISGRR